MRKKEKRKKAVRSWLATERFPPCGRAKLRRVRDGREGDWREAGVAEKGQCWEMAAVAAWLEHGLREHGRHGRPFQTAQQQVSQQGSQEPREQDLRVDFRDVSHQAEQAKLFWAAGSPASPRFERVWLWARRCAVPLGVGSIGLPASHSAPHFAVSVLASCSSVARIALLCTWPTGCRMPEMQKHGSCSLLSSSSHPVPILLGLVSHHSPCRRCSGRCRGSDRRLGDTP